MGMFHKVIVGVIFTSILLISRISRVGLIEIQMVHHCLTFLIHRLQCFIIKGPIRVDLVRDGVLVLKISLMDI